MSKKSRKFKIGDVVEFISDNPHDYSNSDKCNVGDVATIIDIESEKYQGIYVYYVKTENYRTWVAENALKKVESEKTYTASEVEEMIRKIVWMARHDKSSWGQEFEIYRAIKDVDEDTEETAAKLILDYFEIPSSSSVTAKKMTLEEIEKELGYKIEVVHE